jgi:hypothetical protein
LAKGSLSRRGGLANKPNKLINRINYFTNPPINQLTNPPINQSKTSWQKAKGIWQKFAILTNSPIHQLINWPIDKSTNQPLDQLTT